MATISAANPAFAPDDPLRVSPVKSRALGDSKEACLMRKSTIIASCLVNSSMISRLEDAESTVRQVFQEEFSGSRFSEWDQEIADQVAMQIIGNVGRASQINVKRFIEDLW